MPTNIYSELSFHIRCRHDDLRITVIVIIKFVSKYYGSISCEAAQLSSHIALGGWRQYKKFKAGQKGLKHINCQHTAHTDTHTHIHKSCKHSHSRDYRLTMQKFP